MNERSGDGFSGGDYLQDRVVEQYEWHNKKASLNQKRFYVTETIALVVGALIPVVNVLPVLDPSSEVLKNSLPLVNSLMGATIVVAVGAGKLWKFQENWLQYRALAEALLREKELFCYEVGDYQAAEDGVDLTKLLVDRVEDMLATNTRQFVSRHRAAPDRPGTAKKILQKEGLVAKDSGAGSEEAGGTRRVNERHSAAPREPAVNDAQGPKHE